MCATILYLLCTHCFCQFASLDADLEHCIDLLHTTGMNLLDLRKKVWAPEILAHAAPGLATKLGDVCASHTIVGKIAPYFHKRYGFAEVRLVVH